MKYGHIELPFPKFSLDSLLVTVAHNLIRMTFLISPHYILMPAHHIFQNLPP